MIQQINVRTWGGFLKRLAKLQRDEKELLFRGHADARWLMATTLERRGRERMLVADYYRTLGTVTPLIESVTGETFEKMPSYPEMQKKLEEYQDFSLILTFGPFPVAEYLAHIRHHGFPSPLLDWTRSAFVAAFFAFAAEQKGVKRRSIYVWSRARIRSHNGRDPELHKIGHYLRTHRRHVLQQCEYTVCADYNPEHKEWRFASQQEFFTREERTDTPERIWKFNIPSKERVKVLKFLDAFNLNAYTLFGSDEALMDTMSLRAIELHDE